MTVNVKMDLKDVRYEDVNYIEVTKDRLRYGFLWTTMILIVTEANYLKLTPQIRFPIAWKQNQFQKRSIVTVNLHDG
jgi:hypothetical protein